MEWLPHPNIYNVIDNLQMLWMGIWICHHAITTTHLLAQILGVSRNYGTLLDPNCCHDTVVQETHMELSHIHSKHLQGD